MKVYLVAFCGILLAAPAFAEPSGTAGGSAEGASTATSTPAQSQAAPNTADRAPAAPRQICRRIDSDVSRRIGSRVVCHTAQEWRALQDES